MEKLGDITVENSFNLVVSCQLDQNLLARNFTTIINALKELQNNQQKTDSQIKDLSSLKDKLNSLQQRVDKNEKAGSNSKDLSEASRHVQSDNTDLAARVDKNEKNILDNIKDINLINKDVSDLKKVLDELRSQLGHPNASQPGKNGPGYELSDIASNMSKQLQINSEKMKDLEVRLIKAEDKLVQHEKQIKDLQESRDKNKSGQSPALSNGKAEKDLEQLKRDLRERLEMINRKISNLQSDTDNHEQQINNIKDILADHDTHEHDEHTVPPQKDEGTISSKDMSDLKRKIDQVDRREAKDIRNLLDQLNSLKQQLKSQDEKIGSISLIEEENAKSNTHRKSTIQKDDFHDKLNDLILKVNYLEKLISGSKTSIIDDKNPEKLPSIKRHKLRDPNLTGYHEKDKAGVSRKDLAELKAQLQAWIKMLLDENREKENFEQIELKIQEIKKSLQKKADAEGTKKGFTFLENKITQLYLFLTEPDTEDAMIVRKGFNCLSCSKRVEKLRGRIGPKLNWNSMTTTNYSPPKVGYSKPMGETSLEKEDDL